MEKTFRKKILRILFGRTVVVVGLLLLQCVLLFSRLYDILREIPLLFGGVEVFTAAMLLHVLNCRDNPSFKLTWCILIAVLPVFGTLLYFFIRFDVGHRMTKKLVEDSIRSCQPWIPEQRELKEAIRREDPALFNLTRYMERCGNFPVYGNTEVRYFPLGEDMFQEMLRQLETAKRFIFLEYFSVAPGYLWDSLLEVLTRKAREGVEVRLLYDGMTALANLPHDYPRKLEKLGIRCKVFSPVRPFVSTHYNNRDHRKIAVIDGAVAFTGGINLEDRYINRERVYGHWKDTAVMVRGEAAQGFTLMFLQMWNHTERNRIYEPWLALPQEPIPAEGYVIPYADSPMDEEQVGKMVYLDILNRATDYVWIMTPYLILDNEMLTALTFAARRGVDVRLVLPHIPDKRIPFLLARSHYAELSRAGVKLYEYTPGFVHGKVFLSDDRHAVVGTINLDYRSLYHHFECAAYLYKVPALREIRADFLDTMEKSQPVTREDIRNQPLPTRLAARLLKLVAPLM